MDEDLASRAQSGFASVPSSLFQRIAAAEPRLDPPLRDRCMAKVRELLGSDRPTGASLERHIGVLLARAEASSRNVGAILPRASAW